MYVLKKSCENCKTSASDVVYDFEERDSIKVMWLCKKGKTSGSKIVSGFIECYRSGFPETVSDPSAIGLVSQKRWVIRKMRLVRRKETRSKKGDSFEKWDSFENETCLQNETHSRKWDKLDRITLIKKKKKNTRSVADINGCWKEKDPLKSLKKQRQNKNRTTDQ